MRHNNHVIDRGIAKKQYMIFIIDFIIIGMTAFIIFYCFDLKLQDKQLIFNLNLNSIIQFMYPIFDFLLLGYYTYLNKIKVVHGKKVFISLTIAFIIWTMGDFINALETLFNTNTTLGGTFLTIGLILFMIFAYIVKISEDKKNNEVLELFPDNSIFNNYAVAMTAIIYIFAGLYIYCSIFFRGDYSFNIMGSCAILMLVLISLRFGLAQHETKLKMNEMSEAANLDPLTGLYNRRYAFKLIGGAFKSSKSLDIKVSALMIDIDHFKKYNDTFGHACGDQILRDITHIINNSINISNIICRYGGEEILVVLPGADENMGMEVAENIRANVEKYIFYYENMQPVGKVTISIGGATADNDTLDEFQLIKKADYALYESKKSRNRCSWIDMGYFNEENEMKS
ncbi:MAG: GGDEF domain-containing protein [Solirubrobacterales bacterium]